MFEGRFQEGKEQSVVLQEISGVVSGRSFEMLVQWLYVGRVKLSKLPPNEAITAIIEFLRLADMCQVTGMEQDMVNEIKAIMVQDIHLRTSQKHPDTNTSSLT